MESSFLSSAEEALEYFQVDEHQGLSGHEVLKATEKYGRNGTVYLLISIIHCAMLIGDEIALPEDPPTPLWKLVLEQFKDQLVIILLGSAAISFVLALFEDEEGWTAFVDPAVVSAITSQVRRACVDGEADLDHPYTKRRCWSLARKQRGKGNSSIAGIFSQRG